MSKDIKWELIQLARPDNPTLKLVGIRPNKKPHIRSKDFKNELGES